MKTIKITWVKRNGHPDSAEVHVSDITSTYTVEDAVHASDARWKAEIQRLKDLRKALRRIPKAVKMLPHVHKMIPHFSSKGV